MIVLVFIVAVCLALPFILRHRSSRQGRTVLSPKDEAIVARLRHELVRLCLAGRTPLDARRYACQAVVSRTADPRERVHQLMLIDVAYGRILSD